jgi:hypothetical protein
LFRAYIENEGSIFLRNVGIHLTNFTESQARISKSSCYYFIAKYTRISPTK